MRRATAVLARGTWPAAAEIATVTLAFAERHRRRIAMTDDAGAPFLLDLDRPRLLADGDGLAVAGAGVIRVRATVEPVIEVRCASAAEAARIAWHLGNRHAPVEVLADGVLRFADDPVLAAMVAGLGPTPKGLMAPFSPEPAAYAGDGRRHADADGDADTDGDADAGH